MTCLVHVRQNLGIGRRDLHGGGPGGALQVSLQRAVAARFNVRVNVKAYGYRGRCAVVDRRGLGHGPFFEDAVRRSTHDWGLLLAL